MADRPSSTVLSEQVQASINRPGSFVVLATLDDEGAPSVIPVGSLVARGPELLLMGLRGSLRSLGNMRVNPQVALLHMAGDCWVTIKGHATVGEPIAVSAEFFGEPCLQVSVRVREVRSVRGMVSVLPFTYWTWKPEHVQAVRGIRDFLLGCELGTPAG